MKEIKIGRKAKNCFLIVDAHTLATGMRTRGNKFNKYLILIK